jgi:2-oxoglutarate ferredoxin oxidoreductase subunit alpha
LLVGWGSTFGPIRESVDRLREEGHKAGCLHMRHLHPMPQDLGSLFAQYDHVIVVEMNDAGAYGFGQLAMLLRAKLADPRITSLTKTDGLAFRIREVVTGVEKVIAASQA